MTREEKIDVKNKKGLLTQIKYTGVLSMLLIPGLMIFAVIYLLRYNKEMILHVKATLIFIIFNMSLYLFLVNLIEVGENNRFMFEIEPLIYILMGFLVMEIYKKVHKNLRNN